MREWRDMKMRGGISIGRGEGRWRRKRRGKWRREKEGILR